MKDKLDESLKNNRIQNAARMTVTGFLYVIVSIVCPFIIRTLMIYRMGDDYAGINTVLYSVISMLNMTELGLGSVIVYFLYEPAARGDVERISVYLGFLKRIYKYIAIIVGGIGVAFMPFLKLIINDEIPVDANLYSSYLVFLMSSIVLYIGLPEVDLLFNAYQRGDIVNNIKIFSSIFTYIFQVISIVFLHSFICYYIAIFLQSVLVVVLRYREKKDKLSYRDTKGNISIEVKEDIKKRVFAMLGHQMDEKFLASIDNVILSFFCGLSLVTLYGNYMYVVSALGMFFNVLFNSLTLTLGNAIVTESKGSNYKRFKTIFRFNILVVVWIFVCMSSMYDEFMNFWMGDRLFPFDTMVLFCVYFFVMQIRKTVISFKNANGMWWEDRYKPYISMIFNLILDIIMVRYIGVNGALLSSIVCVLLIEVPWEAKVLISDYFGEDFIWYFCDVFIGLVVCLIGGFTGYKICGAIRTHVILIDMIIHFILCTSVFLPMFGVLYKRFCKISAQ